MRELRNNLDRLVGQWLIVALAMILGAMAGMLYTKLTPSTYTSSALLIATVDQSAGSQRDVSFAQAYGRLVGQRDIAAKAGQTIERSADDVRMAVRASTSPNSPIIEIAGTGATPQVATDTVNAVAGQVVAVAASQQADTGVRLLVLSAATPPTDPSSPLGRVDIIVGVAAGFLLGGLVALARAERRQKALEAATRPWPTRAVRERGRNSAAVNGEDPLEPQAG